MELGCRIQSLRLVSDATRRQTDRVANFLELGLAQCALLATIAEGELRYCTGCKDTGCGVRQMVLLGARQVPVR